MPEQRPQSPFPEEFKVSSIFSFPTVEDWEQLAEAGLSGRKLKDLRHAVAEDVGVKTLYTQADQTPDPGLPGHSPFLRGSSADLNAWISCPLVDFSDPESGGRAAAFATARDAGSLWLRCTDPWTPGQGEPGVPIITRKDLDKVLQGIDLEKIQIHLDAGANSPRLAVALVSHCSTHGIPLEKLRGSFGFDPTATLGRSGYIPQGLKAQQELAATLSVWAFKHCPEMRSSTVSSLPYHNAGASAVDELGISLATTLEMLRHMEAAGMSLETAAGSLLFRIAVGSDFFTGIAKIRALRLLWAQLASHCGIPAQRPPAIHAVGSRRGLSRRNPWLNILRQTVETFAAIAGGAELITTRPFDAMLHDPENLAQRMALNTQTILREECHLDTITDPGGGSWYIEKLSLDLAQAAWRIFQKIERDGGMGRSLLSGKIHQRLSYRQSNLEKQLRTRKAPVTGVSTWARVEAKIPPTRRAAAGAIQADISFDFMKSRADSWMDEALRALERGMKLSDLGFSGKQGDSIQALAPHRDAEAFEALQDRAAESATLGRKIGMTLLRLGSPSDFSNREGFATNFFSAGGILCNSIGSFECPADAGRALRDGDHRYICLVSSDSRYLKDIPELIPALRKAGARHIFLAGQGGENAEDWRRAGIEAFIHRDTDVIEFLSKFLDELEVEA